MKNWYLGTIGFSYKDWAGPFYPAGMNPRSYLSYYSKGFNSVEINTTFHSTPRREIVESWALSTPPGFQFAVKVPRRITHELSLLGTMSLLDEFFDSLQYLGDKLGPILLQLPPNYTQDHFSELEGFLSTLPSSCKFCIEFRHKSWYNDRTYQLLSRFNVCWVSNDFPKLPKEIFPTANFLYLRWIGVNGMYQKHTHERVDTTPILVSWLEKIQSVSNKVEAIYGYFNNDFAGFAAGTCKRFKMLAGMDNSADTQPYQERFL